MEGLRVRARWLGAVLAALHAAAAGADPAGAASTSASPSTSAPAPTSTSTPTSTPTGSPAPVVIPPAAPALGDEPPAPYRAPSPRTGDFRWNLSFELGPAASGAPNGLLGVGLALGTIEGIRIETNVLLGFSTASKSVGADPAWNDSWHSYTGAEWSSRTVLFELAASRRRGPLEVWLGGGAHVSWPQWEGSYTYLRCTDLLCFGPKVPTSDSDVVQGTGAVGLLVGAGVRLAILDRLLLGVSVRWLAPATSHVGAQFQRDVRMGGLAVGTGLTLRLGDAVPRSAGPGQP